MKWQSILFVLGAITSQVIADDIDCQSTGTPDNLAKVETIKEGIDYLNGLSGQPTAEAGKCNRVSCSYGSGISLCSDDGKDHPLKNWKTVGSVTQKVMDECAGTSDYFAGRLWSDDGWSVQVGSSSC
ncbi:uncharacterized protein N7469_007525 [Penicillium citrinum]|uniref:Secreted protein n=2 Tax=Penicillium TaxID=5073 RepID=A0A9W9NWM5_PENCI|nr:uncharacterized protein N7469_007525 [Penicillium citrinum]KAJ5227519.1 hypothetical protein N7469_007525 [Penicillium citrinum]KAJ5568004.1 hypothetical protein N7450_010490 [Penicillium hetheringtonii]